MLAHAEAAIISVHNTLPVSTSFKTTLGSCTGIGACAPGCPPFFKPKGIMRCIFTAAWVFASNGHREEGDDSEVEEGGEGRRKIRGWARLCVV